MSKQNKSPIYFITDKELKEKIISYCEEKGTTLTFILNNHIKDILRKSNLPQQSEE